MVEKTPLETINKTPRQSKKFMFAFYSVTLIAAILVAALVLQPFGWPMAAFMCIGIFAIGIIAIGLVLGQASVDKFTNGIFYLSRIGGSSDSVPKDDVEEV